MQGEIHVQAAKLEAEETEAKRVHAHNKLMFEEAKKKVDREEKEKALLEVSVMREGPDGWQDMQGGDIGGEDLGRMNSCTASYTGQDGSRTTCQACVGQGRAPQGWMAHAGVCDGGGGGYERDFPSARYLVPGKTSPPDEYSCFSLFNPCPC